MPESVYALGVRTRRLAGGSPAASSFSCSAKKRNQKKAAPAFGETPGISNLSGAAKELASLRHLSLACGNPSQVQNSRRRQRGGKTVARHRFSSPLSRQFFRGRSGELGEHCLSPKGELRSRPNGLGKVGNPKGDEAGRAFFGYFLCTSKESNALPGAPGQSPI